MTPTIKTIPFGNRTLTLETGVIARQASGSILVDMDGTTVLVTVVGHQDPNAQDKGFFPLRVDYQEKTYAAGIIPGGFFKREGRPSEREILIARLIDRPIRPLFHKQFFNEVQIIATVLSMNPEVEPDILAMIGASAALAISGIPFEEPMAAARVGYSEGCYMLNPTPAETANSKLNLVVAGTESSVLMVESEAQELSETIMLGAIMFGHNQFQPVIKAIKELAKEVGKNAWDWQPAAQNAALAQTMAQQYQQTITGLYQIRDKQERYTQLKAIRSEVIEKFVNAEDAIGTESEVIQVLSDLESQIVRSKLLRGELRIDGRDANTVRPITIKTGLLGRTHGSALFTRGETQALVVVTLGTTKDAQTMDSIMGQEKESFMLHYNFPPFSVGEIGQVGSPKRREVGHGKLAKRGLQAVMPTMATFPYVIRLVSEITESNGSSSMASVCGGSLALMDAGVPIKAPVAGIAMGLIKENNDFVVLTDILGDEDHLGDMDFKVTGTDIGITALQMDIKIYGITEEIMVQALESARTGRLHILGVMSKALKTSRQDLSAFAPRIISMQISPEKIKDVIGKGGSVIRGIIEETGASIDITDDGLVQIASVDKAAGLAAQRRIEAITAEAEVGKIYPGKVVRITDFGAFVNIMPGRDGLLHISQISHERVENVSDVLEEGQEVQVKLIEIDRQGRFKLSIKDLSEEDTDDNTES